MQPLQSLAVGSVGPQCAYQPRWRQDANNILVYLTLYPSKVTVRKPSPCAMPTGGFREFTAQRRNGGISATRSWAAPQKDDATEMPPALLDVMIPVVKKDFHHLSRCIGSIRRHARRIGLIFVVSPDQPSQELLAQIGGCLVESRSADITSETTAQACWVLESQLALSKFDIEWHLCGQFEGYLAEQDEQVSS